MVVSGGFRFGVTLKTSHKAYRGDKLKRRNWIPSFNHYNLDHSWLLLPMTFTYILILFLNIIEVSICSLKV